MRTKVNAGTGRRVTIVQKTGDVKAGIKQRDLSRISAYSGEKGIHTGARSKTVGRHGSKFGK